MEIVIEDEETPVATNRTPTSNSPQIVIEDDQPSGNGKDVRAAVALSDTAPEEAAQNINRSKLFNVSPDSYKNNKANLDPQARAFEDVPDTIEPETEKFIAQSEQHASLAQKDIDKMNVFERRYKYYSQKLFDVPERQREINDLISEKMDTPDGKIDPAKEAQLQSLNAEIQAMDANAKTYGIGEGEAFGVEVASAAGDMIRSYTENKALIASIVGGFTLIGGGAGAITPIPGATVVGLTAGFTKGVVGASAIVSAIDGYKQTSRSLYNELSQTLDENGKPIPHEKMVNVSQAVGAISGLAAGVAGKALASNNPFMKRFLNPKLASKYLGKTPAMMARFEIMGGIAKSIFSEGSEEGFQEFVQIAGEAFGKMDDTESSFLNAIDSITQSFNSDTLKRVGKAALVGGATGGLVQTVTSAPGYPGLKKRFEEVEYVTKRKADVLETQNNMLELAEDMKNMKMKDLSPSEMNAFSKKVFASLGVDENVWMQLDDAREFANSPEKAAAFRKAIDPTGEMTKMAQELNIPLSIPKADFLNIVAEFPEVSDYMRTTPDGENPLMIRNEGKDFADKLKNAEAKRQDILSRLTPPDESNPLVKLETKQLVTRMEFLRNKAQDAIDAKAPDEEVNAIVSELNPYEAEWSRRGNERARNAALNDKADLRQATKDESKKIRNEKKQIFEELTKLEAEENPLKKEPERIKELKEKNKVLNEQFKTVTAQLREMDGVFEGIKDSKYINSRESYLDQAAIQPIEGIVTEEEAADLNDAVLNARLAIDAATVAPVDKRFDRYAEAEFKTETEAEIKLELESLDKEFTVIEAFNRTENLNESQAKIVSEHKKKGFSPFAIDPTSLSEAQKVIYNSELYPSRTANLKKRKVFVEGGIHIDEAAILNGFESGDELLKVLAETPSKKNITERIKSDPLRTFQKQSEINESMEATKAVARDEAFSNLTKAHLKEMDFLVKKEWSTIKRGIIKIAKKVPTLEALNAEAKSKINKMKIRDVNPKAFEQGEKRSQEAALKHYLNGEFEAAFDAKEKAALNNEMRKEALKLQDRVEKNQKFWKRLGSDSNMQELKDAKLNKTMDDFMSVYKLDGAIRNEAEQNSFNNYVKKQEALGNYVPVVPDRLTNTQASYKDLTAEQYQTITEMGQNILDQAKMKNKFLQMQEERKELRTAETIAQEIDTLSKEHPNFDPANASSKNTNYLSPTEVWHRGVETLISAFSNIKTIASDLDQQKMNGFFYRTIAQPIKNARTAKRLEIRDFETRDKEIIERLYGKDFKEMYKMVNVPEFKGLIDLGDGQGNIRKTDLLVMQAYMGDPDYRNNLLNYGDENGGRTLTPEIIQKVLDTHLEERDARFVQEFLLDRFNPLKDRSAQMHKRTTGIDAEMIEGVPFVHKGKVYPGGYYPGKYKMTSDEVRANKFLSKVEKKQAELGLASENEFYAKMRTAEMTKQDRLKQRTGSLRPLDLNFENFIGFTEEALHDLHFREPGIDVLKVLKDPLNVKNIKSVVGTKKFTALLNGVKDTVSKTTERESTLFGDQYQAFNNIIKTAHSFHAIKTIGFNYMSALIQPASLANVVLRNGPKSVKYMVSHIRKMSANASQLDKYIALAADINKDIGLEQDGIDHSVVKQSYDFIPATSGFFKNYNGYGADSIRRINELQTKAQDASFFMVRKMDRIVKALATNFTTEQFLNGDIEGFDLAKVQAMSDAERAKTLQQIVQQTSDLSLTANATEDQSPIEKNPVAKIFVRYFTDRRAALNTILAQVDKVKGSVRKGDNAKAVQTALYTAVVLGTLDALISVVRNNDDSIIKQALSGEDEDEIVLDALWNFAKAPLDQTLDYIPLVADIKYQSNLKSRSDYRNVGTPLTGVMSDIAAGVVIMQDVLDQGLKGRTPRLSDVQRKILLTNAGYLMGGAPTNTMYKAYEAVTSNPSMQGVKYLKTQIVDLHETIDTYINEFKDDKEAEVFIDDLKEYKKTLPQFDADVKNIIPENTKETLKTALSEGKWDKYDPTTGAAGIYQFTEERWNELKIKDPTLGLTDNGRVAKDPSQQERAMNWEIQDNTRGLLTYEIPVTEANLLGAHKFGFDNFVAIHESKDNEKLSGVLGEESKNPMFKDFETVGDVKKYLSGKASKGK